MRILHVLNDFPYPANHGGRVDFWGRARLLAELGHQVETVVTVRRMPDTRQLEVMRRYSSQLTVVPRQANWRGILAREPGQVRTRRPLSQLRFSKPFDAVLLEQEYVMNVLEAEGLEYGRAILRVHNDEAAYYDQLAQAEATLWKRLYYKTERRRFQTYSALAFRSVDELWFISWDQYNAWLAAHGGEYPRASWLPASLPGPVLAPSTSNERVLIAGNLFQPTNVEGLNWYLDQVHPKLRHIGGYQLWVAGSTGGRKTSRLLARLNSDPGIRVFANVPDLEPIFRSCAVAVNPMRRGTSVKLKTLDAICHGLPLVSTPTGIEGTALRPGVHVLVAETGDEMAGQVAALLGSAAERRNICEAAQDFLSDVYDGRRQLAALLEDAPERPKMPNLAIQKR